MNRKRLGIFCFYEKKGVVRDYICFLLDEMIKNLDRFIVICNGELNEEGREKFLHYTEEVLIRENKGFDVSAYREILLHYLDWDEIGEYDELLLFNDTFYGPFYPMEEVFRRMENIKANFWGINRQFAMADGWKKCDYGYLPEHISSYFMIFRKEVILNNKFQDYWVKISDMETVEDVVCKHEVIFTKFLEDLGFQGASYVDLNKYRMPGRRNYNYLYMKSYDLLKNGQMPFIKRKALSPMAALQFEKGKSSQAKEAIKYIENATEYTIDYLWEDLLAKENIYDIYESLHLDYIISEEDKIEEANNKKAIFWRIEKKEILDLCIAHIIQIVRFMDVYVIAENDEKVMSELENHKMEGLYVIQCVSGNKEEDWLHKLKDKIRGYDLVCIIYQLEWPELKIEQESDLEEVLSNLCASQAYVNNVEELFKKEIRLGCLLAPQEYRKIEKQGKKNENLWRTDEEYRNSMSWLAERGVSVKCGRNDKLFTNIMTGWFRADLLQALAEEIQMVSDSIQLQKVLPYLIQNKGYYIGKVCSKNFAERQLSQLYFYKTFDSGIKKRIADFCRQNESVVIYGAGVYAKEYAGYLNEMNMEYKAFVVEDVKENPKILYEKPVLTLDQVETKQGILLGLNRENQKEVLPKLIRAGYENVFWD